MVPFKPGQRWTYHTRSGEETSTLLILEGDSGPLHDIVHVRLDGLRLHNPHQPSGLQPTLEHTPLQLEALRASVVDLIEEHVVLPGDRSGYQTWQEAFERGEAGAFSVPVAQIVAMIDEALNPGSPQHPLFQKQNAGILDK